MVDTKVMYRWGAIEKLKLIPRASRLLHFPKESGSIWLVGLIASMDLFCFQLLADEGEAWHVCEGADQEYMIFSLLGAEPFPQPWSSPGTLTPAPPPTQTSVSLQPKKVSFLWKGSNRRGWVQICICLWIYSGRKVKAQKGSFGFEAALSMPDKSTCF